MTTRFGGSFCFCLLLVTGNAVIKALCFLNGSLG